MSEPNIRDAVKKKYGEAARRATAGGSSSCGAAAATTSCGCDPITSNLYDAAQSGEIPAEAMQASLGCGNPTALAKLNAGETVLDLGSGGCIAGALEESDYLRKLQDCGFADAEIEPTRIYQVEDAREFLSGQGLDVDAIAPQVDGKFFSAFIRAAKPAEAKACCGSDCC